MCLRVALPTQMSRRSTGGRGECSSGRASFFLGIFIEYDLISGQAMAYRAQWGWRGTRSRAAKAHAGPECAKPLQYHGTNMVDRKDTFPCHINPVLGTICSPGPTLWSSPIVFQKALDASPLHYNTKQVLYLWMKEWGGVSSPSTHSPLRLVY